MSKKKSGKKKKAPKQVQEPVKVVEITAKDDDPASKKQSAGGVILKVAAVVFAAALLVGAGILGLRLQPLSKAYSLVVSTSSFTFRVGDENHISYSFRKAADFPLLLRVQEDKKQNISFTSSDPAVVSVDQDGHLTAVGPGTAEISVSVEDMTETVHVDSLNRCSSLSFPETLYELNAGEELKLEAVKIPEDGVLYEEISYSLSAPGVLSFDENGLLKADHPGTCIVRAEAEGLAAETEVRIYQPMTGLFFTKELKTEEITIERGTEGSFPVRFWPVTTTDSKEVTYSLSDPEAGTITPEGVFTAEKLGKVVLTAECNGFSDQVEIEVLASLRGIELNTHEKTIVYRQQDQLSYALIPEDTTDELEVQWISENPGTVTVDVTGRVTAVGPGTAAVTVNVNGFTDRCVYRVHVPVTGVTISAGKMTLKQGQSAQLGASVYPSFATEDRSITWRSDNPNIASVSSTGVVKAVNGGTTRIYAIHGNYSSSCLVTVYVPVPRSVIADRIINYGKQFLGTRYVYGGESLTGGIDCSSLVQKCFATQGIGLPRNSASQSQCGSALPMDPSAWLPGDLLFYSPKGYVSHVAIYIGDGLILQASQSMGCVCITSYNYNGFTPSRARRIF